MAWFKLNDSLNTLKDQLSNVSNVVQEAFQENPDAGADDDADPWSRLDAEKLHSSELSALCGTQSQEIATLRRQIQDLQLMATAAPSTSTTTDIQAAGGSGHSKPGRNDGTATSTLEDSWFWESEPATGTGTTTSGSSAASSASHRDEPGSASGVTKPATTAKSSDKTADDLKLVSLDDDDADTRHRLDTDRHAELAEQFKRARIENAILNEKLAQLNAELGHAQRNLEQLDGEHAIAIDEVLHMKESLQRKCAGLEQQVKGLSAQRDAHSEEAETAEGRLTQLEATYTTLRKYTDEVIASRDAMKERLAELEQTATQHGVELAEKLALFEQLGRENGVLVAKLEALQSVKDSEEQHNLERIVKELEAKLSAVNAEIVQKSEQSVSDGEKLCTAEQLVKDLEQKLQAADAEIAQRTRNIEELARLSKDSEEQHNLERVVQELEAKLNAVNAEIVQTSEKSDNYSKELRTAEQLVKDLEQKLQAADAEIVQKSRHIDELTRLEEINKDLELKLNTVNVQAVQKSAQLETSPEPAVPETASIPLEQLADILRPFAPVHGDIDIVRQLQDTLATIDQFKFDMESLAEKNHQLGETNARVQHAKDTAQADLHHYELELAEVMKNNELLLAELEAVKAGGKLETISEQNEDNIIHLEQQLEDCSNLNQSLEDEYQEMRDKLEAADVRVRALEEEAGERDSILEELRKLVEDAERRAEELAVRLSEERGQMKVQQERVAEMDSRLQEVDGERSTAAFELDELRAKVLCLAEEKTMLEQQQAEQTAQGTKRLEEASALLEKHEADIVELRRLLEKKSADVSELLEQLHAQKTEHAEQVTALQASATTAAATPSVQDDTLVVELQQSLAVAAREKAELVALCTAKHAESVQYHEEIQRLGRLLNDAEVARQVAAASGEQLLAEQAGHQRAVAMCEQMRAERVELLAEAQRLRSHLLEVEEAHVQESMEAQQAMEQLQVKLAALEQEARKSSTAYTSASIRANQHTETLQAQYHLLVQQRDEFSAKLSAAEDKESRSEAALINLQCALEQFQNNKERDIVERTQHMQRQLDAAAAAQQKLQSDLAAVQQQLSESKHGLLAAARITDQLENAQIANTNLRDELHLLQLQQATVQQQLDAANAAQADKADKGLLKNLLIGYVSAPQGADKQQVLKLIASVLGFEEHEAERVGLGSGRNAAMGWIGAIRNAALVVGQSTSVGMDTYNKEGIAQAFVRFLENESRPKEPSTAPSLLNIVPTTVQTTAAAAPTSTTATTIASSTAPAAAAATATTVADAPPAAIQPIVINDGLLQSFAPSRNTSTILKDILSDS